MSIELEDAVVIQLDEDSGPLEVTAVAWSAVTGKPTTFPAGGGAGGVLSGTYPNPGFAQNMVFQDELLDRFTGEFHVSSTDPGMAGPGLWVQTFPNGDLTMWVSDGAP